MIWTVMWITRVYLFGRLSGGLSHLPTTRCQAGYLAKIAGFAKRSSTKDKENFSLWKSEGFRSPREDLR